MFTRLVLNQLPDRSSWAKHTEKPIKRKQREISRLFKKGVNLTLL
jgi:hypothetical protein